MKEITITNIGELTEALYNLDSYVEFIDQAKRLRWWFRGQRDASWNLLPLAKRGYDEERERFLTNDFYARAGTRHLKCPNAEDYAGWLALMQHFGLPTRLLDWTSSPLIAAYFATEHCLYGPATQKECDCAIWALTPGLFNFDMGFEPYVYPLDARTIRKLIKPAFKGHDATQTIVAAMAVENDLRLQVQQGSFTVHSSRIPINELNGKERWLIKIIIPVKHTRKIACDLQLLGFRRGDLFPDLEHLSQELKGLIKPD